MERRESYNNLLDFCLALDEDKELAGKAPEIFRKILTDYFFQHEVYESKKMENFFRAMEMPKFLSEGISLVDVDIDRLLSYIEGETFKDSLCGRIMLSTEYLKSFYPHHSPSFNKMPSDVQQEIVDAIKEKNSRIAGAFQKMKSIQTVERKPYVKRANFERAGQKDRD